MISTPTPQKNLEPLEQELLTQQAPHQRIAIIEKLLHVYSFVHPARADELLQEFEQHLEINSIPDQELRFHLHKGIVDNQLYKYESAIEHYEKAIEIAEERVAAQELAEIYIDFAGICMNVKETELAEHYLDKADKLLKAFPDDLLEARLNCRIGFRFLYNKVYFNAIEFFIKAERAFTKNGKRLSLKDYYFLLLTYGGLGDIHGHNDDQEQRINAHISAIEIAEQTGIYSRLSWHYLSAGNGYIALTDLENAEAFFIGCLEVEQDASTYVKASATANLGYCLMQKKAYEEALALFDEAEALYKTYSPDDMRNIANISGWRAQALASLGKFRKAKKYFFQALDFAEEEQEPDYKQLSNTYKEFAAFYAQQGDYKKAYEFHIQHAKYSEQYVQEVNHQKQWELEAKFNAEKEKQEAKLLRLQADKLQMKALRAQMNPHFMYNALNAIQNYITSDKGDDAAKYLAKFSKLMRQSLYNSDLEVISLEKELEFLKDYLYINQKLRFDSLNYSVQVEEEIEEDILGVPTMIVQPYVENAIEHGLRTKKTGMIKVLLSLLDEDTILCIVEDNGVGRAAAREFQKHDTKYQNYKSKGTFITEERLKLLHNSKDRQVYVDIIDLFDEEEQPCGTRVEIKIPVVNLHLLR
ncbi:MAG: hypothetical protein Sapg2KO_30790 [Saprospiraceae bacterium]